MDTLAAVGDIMKTLYGQKCALEKQLHECKALEEEIGRLWHESRHSASALKKWQRLEQLLQGEDWRAWQDRQQDLAGRICRNLQAIDESLAALSVTAGDTRPAAAPAAAAASSMRRFV